MTQIFESAVADVATQRKHYVPPQIEVVELDNQGAILTASTVTRSYGTDFADDAEDW